MLEVEVNIVCITVWYCRWRLATAIGVCESAALIFWNIMLSMFHVQSDRGYVFVWGLLDTSNHLLLLLDTTNHLPLLVYCLIQQTTPHSWFTAAMQLTCTGP